MDAHDDGKRMSLLVRNLPYDTSLQELRDHFNIRPDVVLDVYIPKDYVSRRPRGFAFVEFRDEKDAQDALRELDGRELNGRQLGIMVAQQRRKTADQMRQRDGDRDRDRDRRRRSRSRSRSRSYGRRR